MNKLQTQQERIINMQLITFCTPFVETGHDCEFIFHELKKHSDLDFSFKQVQRVVADLLHTDAHDVPPAYSYSVGSHHAGTTFYEVDENFDEIEITNCYGGTFVTPWVAAFRNQVTINHIMGA